MLEPETTFGRPMVIATSSPSLGLEGAWTCSPVMLFRFNQMMMPQSKINSLTYFFGEHMQPMHASQNKMAYKFLVNLNKIIERRIVPLEAQNIYK
jgi:hypothetical protein